VGGYRYRHQACWRFRLFIVPNQGVGL